MPTDIDPPISRRSFLRFVSADAIAVPIFTEAHFAWAQASSGVSAAS